MWEAAAPEASTTSPSRTPCQRQAKRRAAPSLGPPRPIGRHVLAGRPHRPCFPAHRREELPLISTRADAFLQWLHARPEQRIAVVTHSSFLAALCNVAIDSRADLKVGEWFANAEMRHVRLVKGQ